MTEPIYISPQVFFCLTQGQGIFLDLKRDAYSALPDTQGLSNKDDAPLDRSTAAYRLIDAHRVMLLEDGLATLNPHIGTCVDAFLAIDRVAAPAFADDQRAFGASHASTDDTPITIIDLGRFLFACRRASSALRRRRLHEVVEAVSRRKNHGSPLEDIAALRREVSIFRRLRPWYPRSFLCIFDSLAMVEFLASRKMYADWVFAVQAKPFGAHSWVQSHALILNEATEYANEFTPIMIV